MVVCLAAGQTAAAAAEMVTVVRVLTVVVVVVGLEAAARAGSTEAVRMVDCSPVTQLRI